MLMERARLERSGLVVSTLALTAIAAIALGGLTAARSTTRTDAPAFALTVPHTSMAERFAAVDAAITRKDTGRAITEWQNGYSLALRSRRWDAMAAAGDVALRIDRLLGGRDGRPSGFRAEARQAYLRALFLAHRERSPEGVQRVAEAFAALGDLEMAARARAIGVARQ